jgi:hypothetical protein
MKVNVHVLSVIALFLGAIGLLLGVVDSKHGLAISGAILVSGSIVARAIIERKT